MVRKRWVCNDPLLNDHMLLCSCLIKWLNLQLFGFTCIYFIMKLNISLSQYLGLCSISATVVESTFTQVIY